MTELGGKIIHQHKVTANDRAKISNGEEWNDGPFQVLAENMALHQDEAKRSEAERIICRGKFHSKAIWTRLSKRFARIQPFREYEQDMSGIIPAGTMSNNLDSFHGVKKNNG